MARVWRGYGGSMVGNGGYDGYSVYGGGMVDMLGVWWGYGGYGGVRMVGYGGYGRSMLGYGGVVV